LDTREGASEGEGLEAEVDWRLGVARFFIYVKSWFFPGQDMRLRECFFFGYERAAGTGPPHLLGVLIGYLIQGKDGLESTAGFAG